MLRLGPDDVSDLDLIAIGIQATPDAAILDRVAAEVASGRLRVSIQETFALEEVPRAFDRFASGTLGKIGIRVSE